MCRIQRVQRVVLAGKHPGKAPTPRIISPVGRVLVWHEQTLELNTGQTHRVLTSKTKHLLLSNLNESKGE